ncbi:MAG TPA: trimethylamine methyltransferase family protein [Gaiellales bacterium]
MFENLMPRYEVLSEEAMAVLERGWRRLISEMGVEFLHDEAVDRFRRAGQAVDGNVVRFDPEFVLEQVAKAPSEFDLAARNPERTIHVGGRHMFFAPTQGPPFVRMGDERREATMADFEQLAQLSQVFDELDTPGGLCCEPNDRPLDSRHLDMLLAVQTLTDKPYLGAVITGEAARDSIAMTDILHGANDPERPEARVFAVVNANSPLRFDTRMLEAMLVYAEAGQVNVITPFLLMGAMAPVSTPAALVQQTTEALAGLCLTQLVRPGAPVILGSFLSHTDMQSGSPGFGGPESALGLLASGQIARRFGVPWRAGGGFLTSSQTPDAQAAYEGLNTMLPAFLAGAHYVEHAAGWLESGLVASFEKFIVDIEMLRVLKEEFRPMEIDEASLAFDAHREVGYGGHFFGAAHTLERFRDCFYRPLLSSTENFERWQTRGGQDAAERAARLWREALDRYEQPPLDPALREQLDAYVVRRRAELGD